MEPPTRPRTREERARVLSVLAHHPYFRGLPLGNKRREANAAVGRFFAVHVGAGEAVLSQGQRGDNLYIVDRGRVEVVRRRKGKGEGKGSEGEEVVVASLGPGAVFGEAAALFDSRRGASVRAVGGDGCRLWALGRVDAMALTGRGPPFSLRDFFMQHASVAEGQEKEGKEWYMSYDDFRRALHPSSSSSSSSVLSPHHDETHEPVPVLRLRLLLRALDPTCVRLHVRLCLASHPLAHSSSHRATAPFTTTTTHGNHTGTGA